MDQEVQVLPAISTSRRRRDQSGETGSAAICLPPTVPRHRVAWERRAPSPVSRVAPSGCGSPQRRGGRMTDNRAVTYQGPMKVVVENIDYPTFELKDGPGVNPANVGRKVPHGAILQGRHHQHLRLRPAHGPRPHDRPGGPGPRTRDHRRGHRDRPRTSSSSRSATSCSVPFNIACGRCRNCKEGKTGHLPEREPGPSRAPPTATSTWAAGSAARPSTCWCPTPTGTCCSSRTRTRPWRRSST